MNEDIHFHLHRFIHPNQWQQPQDIPRVMESKFGLEILPPPRE